jgi:hypothetical protein
MSLELLDAIIEGAWGYAAFGIILFGIFSLIAVVGLIGYLGFRCMVLWTIGVIRRRAFYRPHDSREWNGNGQQEASTWKA